MADTTKGISTASRVRGSLLGLAVGDALGTTLENTKEITTQPLTDMVGGGPFHLVAGEFTDDTSTALLLAESLLAKKGFFPHDQLDRYHDWYTNGHLGSNNVCFDIGIGTRIAVLAYKESNNPYPTTESDTRAGNGSLMRLTPVVLAYHNQEASILMKLAAQSSRTTHGAKSCLDACQFYAALISGCLKGTKKEELLHADYYKSYGNPENFCPEILSVVQGSYKVKQPPEIIGGGYVVHALEAALWAFARTESFKDGVLAVANLGNDADTTSAIFGQLAGAYYGDEDIPREWRERLAFSPFIAAMADEIYAVAAEKGFSPVEGASTTHALSSHYESIHECLIVAEREYAEIKRRIEPGPKQFKTLGELNSAVDAFRTAYNASAPECEYKTALIENEFIGRILATQRTKLEQQLAKPKIALPFGLKKS